MLKGKKAFFFFLFFSWQGVKWGMRACGGVFFKDQSAHDHIFPTDIANVAWIRRSHEGREATTFLTYCHHFLFPTLFSWISLILRLADWITTQQSHTRARIFSNKRALITNVGRWCRGCNHELNHHHTQSHVGSLHTHTHTQTKEQRAHNYCEVGNC